jgi:hypothetical protein
MLNAGETSTRNEVTPIADGRKEVNGRGGDAERGAKSWRVKILMKRKALHRPSTKRVSTFPASGSSRGDAHAVSYSIHNQPAVAEKISQFQND